MTIQRMNKAPEPSRPSMPVEPISRNKTLQYGLRREGQEEPPWSYSRVLVPPSCQRERSVTNFAGPSQSSRDREIDWLMVQMLALQWDARRSKEH